MRLYIPLDANSINLHNNYLLSENRMHAGDILWTSVKKSER